MEFARERAVVVCLDRSRSACLSSVLAEAGFGPIEHCQYADEALALLRRSPTALILADSVLSGIDGAGFAQRVSDMPLPVYPDVLLAFPAMFRVPGADRLPGLNAAALCDPVTPEAVRAAIDALRAASPALPPEKAARLQSLLDELGVPPHIGRDMLCRAAALCWRDQRRVKNLRDRVYPDAARPFGRTAAQAERAIRHVIEAAWRTGSMDAQARIFGDTIDAKRGRPTCGQMIARLADILRWEG